MSRYGRGKLSFEEIAARISTYTTKLYSDLMLPDQKVEVQPDSPRDAAIRIEMLQAFLINEVGQVRKVVRTRASSRNLNSGP